MELALAFLLIGGGTLTVYSGLTGQPFVPALRGVLSGKAQSSSSSSSSPYAQPGLPAAVDDHGAHRGALTPAPAASAYPAGTTFDASGLPIPMLAPLPGATPGRQAPRTLPVSPALPGRSLANSQ